VSNQGLENRSLQPSPSADNLKVMHCEGQFDDVSPTGIHYVMLCRRNNKFIHLNCYAEDFSYASIFRPVSERNTKINKCLPWNKCNHER